MKKAGQLAMIVFFVVVAYLLLMATQPIINSIVDTTNTTVAANSDNWDNYRDAQAVLIGWPFWAYMIPAAIGMVAVVKVLRARD